jgi:hypothetical protein
MEYGNYCFRHYRFGIHVGISDVANCHMVYRTNGLAMLALILSMSNAVLCLLLGGLLFPLLLVPDFTAQMLGSIFALVFLFWFLSIPVMGQRDDGTWYELDGKERAEWVRQNGYLDHESL